MQKNKKQPRNKQSNVEHLSCICGYLANMLLYSFVRLFFPRIFRLAGSRQSSSLMSRIERYSQWFPDQSLALAD
uniref:Uncharacterized protein n=1 Tax=Anguilla anguilla TaxID=7936 RepID=A0A0E9WM86_ANGAN